MLNNFASTQGGGTDTVTTTMILDGTIANADVASDAAIDLDKLSQASEQKLGIGTEPTETLHVRDGRTTGGSAGLLIQKFEAVDGTSYGAFVEATGGSTKNIGLYVQAEGGTTNYGLLVPNGSVGIGTTSPKTDLTVEGTVTLKEQAAADGDTAAYGQLWVKSDTPNTLYFTDDAGTDLDLTSGTGDASGPGSATDNAIARFNGTGGKTLQNSSTTISDDGDIVVGGTTPTITIGDGGAEDSMLAFDGNALDFHIALDDTADDLVIGTGVAAGTATLISINGDGTETKFNQPKITVGDATAEDTYIIFDGNAQDFRIGLDDGTDTLEIGGGAAHGTAAGISMDVNGDMTLGGGIACADEVIGRPRFTDYAETINVLGDVGGGTDAIDITAGNVVSATVSTGAQTFTFTNPSATGKSCSFTLFLTNGGSQTVNWPGAVDWAGGSAPSLTSSGVDVLTFTTLDAGTIWYGFAAGLDMG